MDDKICVTFAGVIGSSKTPIAHYLSCNLDLPILSNDTIRTEVTEDCDGFNELEYSKRRDDRSNSLIKNGVSFIYDASIDRFWQDRKKLLLDAGYRILIISLDLSKDKLQKIHKSKGYVRNDIDRFIDDHNNFLKIYYRDIGVHITDETFNNRLDISLDYIKRCLKII